METVILHSCCAPCSAAVLEWMLDHDIRPVVFYFNPNIFPQAEYEKRKNELTAHCQKLGVEVVDGDWDHNAWLDAAAADARSVSQFACVQQPSWPTTVALPVLPPPWLQAAGKILTRSMLQAEKRLLSTMTFNTGTRTGEKTVCRTAAMRF